jgi:hypothetical protein
MTVKTPAAIAPPAQVVLETSLNETRNQHHRDQEN